MPTLQSISVQSADLSRLLNIQEIYYEPAVLAYPRAQSILAHYSNAQLIEVGSHWNIAELHGNEGAVESWNRIKRTILARREEIPPGTPQ